MDRRQGGRQHFHDALGVLSPNFAPNVPELALPIVLVKRILEHRERRSTTTVSRDFGSEKPGVLGDIEVWPGRELSILRQMRPSISASRVMQGARWRPARRCGARRGVRSRPLVRAAPVL